MTEQQKENSEALAPSQPLISAATAGGMLLNARRQAGLSVDEVVAKLKLSRRQVEALEADRYGDLPGNTFVRGFVRNYARLLGVDAQPMLSYLEHHLPSEAPQSALPKLSDDSMPLMRPGGRPGGGLFSKAALGVLIIVLLLLAAYWLHQRGLGEPGLLMSQMTSTEGAGKEASAATPGGPVPTPVEAERVMPPVEAPAVNASAEDKPTTPAAVAPVPVPEPAAPAPKPQAAPTPAVSAAATQPQPAPAPAVKPVPTPVVPAAAPVAPGKPAATPTPTPPAVASAAGDEAVDGVKLVAHEDSWMTVTDATGKRLLGTMVKGGETKVVKGTPPFKVRAGNAQHVEIFYKGKAANLKPFTKVDVVNLVLN